MLVIQHHLPLLTAKLLLPIDVMFSQTVVCIIVILIPTNLHDGGWPHVDSEAWIGDSGRWLPYWYSPPLPHHPLNSFLWLYYALCKPYSGSDAVIQWSNPLVSVNSGEKRVIYQYWEMLWQKTPTNMLISSPLSKLCMFGVYGCSGLIVIQGKTVISFHTLVEGVVCLSEHVLFFLISCM